MKEWRNCLVASPDGTYNCTQRIYAGQQMHPGGHVAEGRAEGELDSVVSAWPVQPGDAEAHVIGVVGILTASWRRTGATADRTGSDLFRRAERVHLAALVDHLESAGLSGTEHDPRAQGRVSE
jgi:hypothetical protein